VSNHTTNSGIYIIRNLKNGKFYLGQTQDLHHRWQSHRQKLRGGNHRNRHLQASWNKYGEKAFKFLILEYCTVEQLDEREQHYLNIYIDKGMCYNVARDARVFSRGIKHSEEHNRKISESLKGHKHTGESIERMRSTHRGQSGHKHSEETKARMREIAKNRPPISDAQKQKMSVSARNRPPISEETRQKISEANKGNKKNLGRHPSEESRQKMSEAQKRHWVKKRDEASEPDENP
jgi:group I intron endonuclease